MDLRPYGLSGSRIAAATLLLNYQPFRISDTIVTGVAHSWAHETVVERIRQPQMVFDATRESSEVWHRAVAASERLDRTYEMFLDTITDLCPGGSYLDLCCNNGYFPVRASLRGMAPAVGSDGADFGPQISFLNDITGASAGFVQSYYRPMKHRFVPSIEGQFDVVSNMAFMTHVADPLQLLGRICELSRHAVLLWSCFPRDDAMTVRYAPLRPTPLYPFPWGFDAGVGVSDSLLIYSMREFGFPNHFEVVAPADGWPAVSGNPLLRVHEPLRAFVFTRT